MLFIVKVQKKKKFQVPEKIIVTEARQNRYLITEKHYADSL